MYYEADEDGQVCTAPKDEPKPCDPVKEELNYNDKPSEKY